MIFHRIKEYICMCVCVCVYKYIYICMSQSHGIIDSMDRSLSKLQEVQKDRETWCATVHGVRKSWI